MAVLHAEIVAGREELVLFAAGGDVDYRRIAGALSLCTPAMRPSVPKGGLILSLTWAAVVQLSAQVSRMRDLVWCPGARLQAWICDQVLARTTPAELTYQTSAGLAPYPWQVSGAQMIASVGSALITDEPGTGKTATAILGVCELRARGGAAGPVLVVCPASVVDPWVEAFTNWGPLRALAWRGTPTQRRALAGTGEVYVTSYDTARIDASDQTSPLMALRPDYLVVDECHAIKSQSAQRTKAVRRLAAKAQHTIALSGTPITHHPGDLWPTLNCLEPGAFPSRERWIRRYCETLQGDYREEILGLDPANEPEFRASLLGQLRRVAKADVLADLPPKIYSTRTVDMPDRWRTVYTDLETQMLAELPDGEELSVMTVLAQMTRLAQLASAAADVTTVTEIVDGPGGTPIERPHTSVRLKRPSWKVDALLEILTERPGTQVVVFAPSKLLINLAGEALVEAGYRVGYITGDVTGAARSSTVAAFQGGELDVICATTGAGGVGLTLTAAQTVVFLQRPWSIVEATQAEDRCHRIGSERHASIEIIDIIARGTIDTRVRAVLAQRAGQLADLVRDPRILTHLLGGDAALERKIA